MDFHYFTKLIYSEKFPNLMRIIYSLNKFNDGICKRTFAYSKNIPLSHNKDAYVYWNAV